MSSIASHAAPQPRALRRDAAIIGGLIAVVGVAVMVGGWIFGVAVLRSLVPGTASMKFNTALMAASIGIAIVSLALRWPSTLTFVAIALTGLTSAATILEYVLALPTPGIDELVVVDAGFDGQGSVGRPGFATAVCFGLLAFSALLFGLNRATMTAQLVATAAGMIGYLSILGYAMHVGLLLNSAAQWTQMAIHTAGVIFLAATALMLLSPTKGYARVLNAPESGGRQARILIPSILLIGLLLAFPIRILVDFGVPQPIPAQVATAFLIIIMLVAVVFVARQSNSLERQRLRNNMISMAVDWALEGVVIVSRTGRIDDVNDTICRMTGYQRDQLIGQSIDMLVPQAARHDHAAERDKFWDEGISRRMRPGVETSLLDALGRAHPVEISLGILDLGEGRDSVIATIRDTSEIVRANQELAQFAYVASHDLRAPLRSVLGFSDLLRESFDENDLDEDQRDYLEEISSGAHRMNQLIEALLSYSKIGQLGDDHSVTSVPAGVDQALSSHAASLEAMSAEVQTDIAQDLTWDVNAPLMNSAISNLVSNSIKYCSPDRPLKLTITGVQTAGATVLIVRDNGMGIAPEQLDRATRMFQRLTTKGEGVGIGLASVKRIVERSGGSLLLTSDGSTFTQASISIPNQHVAPIQHVAPNPGGTHGR